ncbi:hypothetical protein EVAR_48823_1 [Eumeta japonica]|uniref:PiggyBac transposable element-derived protein domain-containing protein n=1 Tax=Eumeta variegata TaxID=151549 RepID=A0A4C1Y502_EUMVA|nr:hypothetical protein EVAR_48823_1 [Eumeta japonica]
MKAFLGSLFYTSVFKSNHENTKSIFATDGSGREIFRCVMSQFRFLTLLNYIRFDDSNTRSQRLETDPLAAISEMFKLFNNCKKAYAPGAYLCVDEIVLDLSEVNAYALYKTCTAVRDIPRAQFLQNLAYSLVLPHLKRRVYNYRLPRELRLTIARVLSPNKPPEPVTEPSESTEAARKTCKICPSRLKRRTKYNCIECRKSIYLGYSKTICVDWVDDK